MSRPIRVATSPERAQPHRWYALALLCTTLFLIILDSSIVIVAIPSIDGDLALSADGAQWVVSAYAVTFGGLLLLGGRAADRLGRRRVFMWGVAVFALSSLGCGLAPSGELLVVARMFQGAGAAMMAPSALSIVMATFVEAAERNRALGFWGATGGIGGTTGALVGGPITQGPGWPWIFFLNVPVCVALLALSPVLLREHHERGRGGSFGAPAAATVTMAAMLLVYAVVQVPVHGWTGPRTWPALVAVAVLGVVFWRAESRSADPLIPPRLARSPALIGGSLVTVAIGMMVFGGVAFTLTLYAQNVLGYSASAFGLMSSINAVMAIVGSTVGQRAVTRCGPGRVAVVSLLITALACAHLTRIDADGTFLTDLLPALLIFGAGLGAGTVAGTIAALSEVEERHSGVASGISTAAFQLGGALGVALISSAAVWRTGRAPAGTMLEDALTDGYRFGFMVAVAIALVTLPLAHILLRPARTTSPSRRNP
ncbi:MFS transporter [Actinomadura fulvescens]|uniref:MFS transporter n=1 Tax=Actinomadura fulvescens TaxID=46160 RepID=A0ABN3PNT2_9ACTN